MFLVAIPILGIGLYIIVNRSHPYFEKVFHIYDDLNGVVQENLTGIRVVKSFIREKFEIKKFNHVFIEMPALLISTVSYLHLYPQ